MEGKDGRMEKWKDGGKGRTFSLINIILLALLPVYPAFSLGIRDDLSKGTHPGVCIYRYHWDEEPCVFHVAEIDRTRSDLNVKIALARDTVLGKETVRSIARRMSRKNQTVVVAINGGFGVLGNIGGCAGVLQNLFVQDGELISIPLGELTSNPLEYDVCFGVTPDGKFLMDIVQTEATVHMKGEGVPILGINQRRRLDCQAVLYTPRFGNSTKSPRSGYEVRLQPSFLPVTPGYRSLLTVQSAQRSRNSSITSSGLIFSVGPRYHRELFSQLRGGEQGKIEIELYPQEWNDVVEAIGGNYRLVRDGKIDPTIMKYYPEEKKHGPGWRGEPKIISHEPRTAIGFNDDKLFLMVADGRQPGYSTGMSLYDVAEVMVKLGAKQAMNLDGGASSTFLVNGKVLNQPSGGGKQRAVLNAVLITYEDGRRKTENGR